MLGHVHPQPTVILRVNVLRCLIYNGSRKSPVQSPVHAVLFNFSFFFAQITPFVSASSLVLGLPFLLLPSRVRGSLFLLGLEVGLPSQSLPHPEGKDKEEERRKAAPPQRETASKERRVLVNSDCIRSVTFKHMDDGWDASRESHSVPPGLLSTPQSCWDPYPDANASRNSWAF